MGNLFFILSKIPLCFVNLGILKNETLTPCSGILKIHCDSTVLTNVGKNEKETVYRFPLDTKADGVSQLIGSALPSPTFSQLILCDDDVVG